MEYILISSALFLSFIGGSSIAFALAAFAKRGKHA